MEKELITIIIPAYKVEKYIKKCIDSIIHQTYQNLEIILVDDGSPDNCGKICDEYGKKDNRIIVIHKENGGLSDARNKGLDIAKGEYILFVDSDDYIEKYTVEYLYQLSQKYKADIVVGKEKLIYENTKKEREENVSKKDTIQVYNKEIALEKMLYNTEFTNMACDKLYRRELFLNERYPVGKLYEDLATTYKIIANSTKVVVGSKKTYNYLIRNNSIMNRKFDIKRLQALEFTEEILEFVKDNYPSIEKAAVARLYMECIFILLKIPNKKEFYDENRKIQNYLRKYRWTVINDKKMPKKQKILCMATIFGRYVLRIIWNIKELLKRGRINGSVS